MSSCRSAASLVAGGFKLDIFPTIQKPFRVAELRQILEKVKVSLPVSYSDSPAEL